MCRCSALEDSAKLFSRVVTPICAPSNGVKEFAGFSVGFSDFFLLIRRKFFFVVFYLVSHRDP